MYYTQGAKQPKVMSTSNNQAKQSSDLPSLILEDEGVNNLFHNSGCDSKMDSFGLQTGSQITFAFSILMENTILQRTLC